MVFLRIGDERGCGDGFDDQTIDRRHGKAERPEHIHEKDNPNAIGLVPDFMLERVVEKQRLSFLPVRERIRHTKTAISFWYWNDEPEVATDDALVGPAVRGDVDARRKDRERCRLRARDGLEQGHGAGAAR